MSDFMRAQPMQNHPELSGHRTKCVSPAFVIGVTAIADPYHFIFATKITNFSMK
jgi:hypothetical protein